VSGSDRIRLADVGQGPELVKLLSKAARGKLGIACLLSSVRDACNWFVVRGRSGVREDEGGTWIEPLPVAGGPPPWLLVDGRAATVTVKAKHRGHRPPFKFPPEIRFVYVAQLRDGEDWLELAGSRAEIVANAFSALVEGPLEWQNEWWHRLEGSGEVTLGLADLWVLPGDVAAPATRPVASDARRWKDEAVARAKALLEAEPDVYRHNGTPNVRKLADTLTCAEPPDGHLRIPKSADTVRNALASRRAELE